MCCWHSSEGTTPHCVYSPCFFCWKYQLHWYLEWEDESTNLWKTPAPWVRETQARPEINIIELKKWKMGGWYTWYNGFCTQVYLFFRRRSSTYHCISLKMLPRGRKSRSLFLPPLHCTHNWSFCHLCPLAKLCMKPICIAWLYFIQNWTVNMFYQKSLY